MLAALWKAFRKYLKKAARDVSIAEDSLNVWDSYLPYAAVFGLTANWIFSLLSLTSTVSSLIII
jgi:uncharacterized membrane protein